MPMRVDAKQARGAAGTRGGGARAGRMVKAWNRLSEESGELPAPGRGELARSLARRHGISVREAKRQVRDLERVVRRLEGRTPSRGKRVRRSFERTGSELGEALARGVEVVREQLGRVLTTGGLAGKSGTDFPLPRKPKKKPAGVPPVPRPVPGAPAAPAGPVRSRAGAVPAEAVAAQAPDAVEAMGAVAEAAGAAEAPEATAAETDRDSASEAEAS
jgi:hypothetical protein